MKPLLDKKCAANPEFKALRRGQVKIPGEKVLKTSKTSSVKGTKKVPIPTPLPIVDIHNFKSVFDDKTPKLLGSGSMAQVTAFLKKYRHPKTPVYALVQTLEHSITLADVEELIRNDKDQQIDLKSPAPVDGELPEVILCVLSLATSIATPVQDFMSSPHTDTPAKTDLTGDQVPPMTSWGGSQGQVALNRLGASSAESRTYVDEVMSPDSDHLVIVSPSLVISDHTEKDRDLLEIQGGKEDEIFKIPDFLLVKLPQKSPCIESHTFEQEYQAFVLQPSQPGVVLETPDGLVEFEIGVLTDQ